jgi:hypothetical protein
MSQLAVHKAARAKTTLQFIANSFLFRVFLCRMFLRHVTKRRIRLRRTSNPAGLVRLKAALYIQMPLVSIGCPLPAAKLPAAKLP